MRSHHLLKTMLVCVSVLSLMIARAYPAESVLIGVAGPFSGSFEILGRQLQSGARGFARDDGATGLTVSDDACEPAGGVRAAESIVKAGATMATGFLCTEALAAALPILAKADIPVLTTGIRTDRLRPRNSDIPPVFRMLAKNGDEERAIAAILVDAWRNKFFAIIDDGTIHARELAESFRLAAENAGLKPAYIDTYRPQMDNQIGLIGRLKKAGVTEVFVAGDRSDVSIMARDAKKLDVDITFAGGEALVSADQQVPLPPGILAVAPEHLISVANTDIMERTLETSGFWSIQYAAMQIAAEAIRISRAQDVSVRDAILSRTFDTKIGPVKFARDGTNLDASFGLYRYDGERFKLVRRVDPSVLHRQ